MKGLTTLLIADVQMMIPFVPSYISGGDDFARAVHIIRIPQNNQSLRCCMIPHDNFPKGTRLNENVELRLHLLPVSITGEGV